MEDYRGIDAGMAVHSADGKLLGKIVECKEDRFVIGRGPFFDEDFEATYDQVVLVRNGEAQLALNEEQLSKAIH